MTTRLQDDAVLLLVHAVQQKIHHLAVVDRWSNAEDIFPKGEDVSFGEFLQAGVQ